MKRLQKRVLIGLLLSITTLIGGINLPVLANSADENGGNLITDGGFDTTSNIPNGYWWKTAPETGSWQYSGDNAVFIETDKSTSNKYAKIVGDTGLGQNTKVELNTTYVLTAKVKGGAATLSINNGSAEWCASESNYLASADIAASNDWQTVTVKYSNKSYTNLFAYLWVTDGNTVYIDDVSLTKKEIDTPDPTPDTDTDTVTITADKTAQWTAQEAHLNYDLRIHGWHEWENAAYIGFTLADDLKGYDIQKAELVITTTGVNNDDENEENHSNYPKAWLYGATHSAFDNAGQYQGTDNAPAYNKDAILEFYSPTATGESRYDVTEHVKSQIETGKAAFRIDVKSQDSNNEWTIGSRNNGGPCPQLVIEYNEITAAEKYEYTTDAELADPDAVGFTATFNASSQSNSLTWFLKKDGGSYKKLDTSTLPTTNGTGEVKVGLIVYDIPEEISGSELSAGYTIE